MAIIVDPYLLAIPTGNDLTAEEVCNYAESLVGWEKQFSTHSDDYVVCEWALNEIHVLDIAPTITNLRALFDRYGVVEYSPRDIAPDCQGFMANGWRLEEMTQVDDIRAEIENIAGSETVIPDEIRRRMPPTVAAAFIQALIYSAYALQKHEDRGAWSMATAPLPCGAQASELKTNATLCRLDDSVEGLTYTTISRNWPLLVEPDYIFATYDLIGHFRSDPSLTTRIAWCKRRAKGEFHSKGCFDRHSFRFGARFLESLETPSMQKRSEYAKDIVRVFDAIVNVLEDIWAYPSDKHHPLREIVTKRTGDQQKRRKRAGDGSVLIDYAVRVEVIAGARPLHLHYWRCSDAAYEFANVTDDHDDPTIYESCPGVTN